jgi:hypothetical protein
LFVSNTTVRKVSQIGILVAAPSSVSLDNVRIQNTGTGVAVFNGARVMINRSVFSGHAQAGVFANSNSQLNLSNSVTSNNGVGVQNNDGTATIRLSNNDIAFNGTAFIGATQSFSNNRRQGNGTLGTAPTPIGLTSNPTGLQ